MDMHNKEYSFSSRKPLSGLKQLRDITYIQSQDTQDIMWKFKK